MSFVFEGYSQDSEPVDQEGFVFEGYKKPSKLKSAVLAPIKGMAKSGIGFNPLQPRGPFSKKQAAKILEETLPTLPEHDPLERAGKIAPYALLGEGGLLAGLGEIAGGTAAGEFAKQGGLGETGQEISEAIGMGLGGLTSAAQKLGKSFAKGKIIPSHKQQEAVKFLREKGFTEKQIVPLIKNENFLNKIINKLSFKGKASEKLQKSIQEKVGKEYDFLRQSGKNKFLSNKAAGKFDNELLDVYNKIPKRYQRLIDKDLEDLRNTGASFSGLIDFWQGLNATTKGVDGGKSVINKFKEPIFEAMNKIDSKDAHTFEYLNDFYSKGKRFLKGLKSGQIEKWLSGGKALATIGALATLNVPILTKILGTHGVQLLLREIALNPRLQNIHLQILKAVRHNDFNLAKQLYDVLEKNIPKTHKPNEPQKEDQ